MKTVYLAGPMSGIPAYNVPAFTRAAADLRSRGYEVISPAECDNEAGQENDALRQALAADPKVGPALRARYLQRDFTLLLGCEAIVLLPGWESSTGATCEALVAAMAGLDLFTAVTSLSPCHLVLYKIGTHNGSRRSLHLDINLIADHVWEATNRSVTVNDGGAW